ncbi:hypothetical protein DBR23_15115 [Acidovorax sp. HMWF018]|nr:hypothetical protein DBR23_15115 [Acidovorax sp. HMWF018]
MHRQWQSSGPQLTVYDRGNQNSFRENLIVSAEIPLKAGETRPLFIRKGVLADFKRFESRTVELISDINIFAGDNEAGSRPNTV